MELGTIVVRRIVAAHDVGRAVNPTLVEGQIHGGIAQGLGMALMEEYRAGRTDNLHDYLIPTVGDMPEIECLLVEDAEPAGPYGAKGVGEPALVPTAPGDPRRDPRCDRRPDQPRARDAGARARRDPGGSRRRLKVEATSGRGTLAHLDRASGQRPRSRHPQLVGDANGRADSRGGGGRDRDRQAGAAALDGDVGERVARPAEPRDDRDVRLAGRIR